MGTETPTSGNPIASGAEKVAFPAAEVIIRHKTYMLYVFV